MAHSLFARKPLALLLEEMKGENRLRRVLGPVQLTSLGVGAIIGTGIFVLTGVAAHDKAGPGADALLRRRRHRLHLRGALLRRVRLDGAGGRLGLHLRLRHARRALRLDHRLGPGPRVRRRLGDRGPRLVALLPGLHRHLRAPAPEGAGRWRRSTTTRRSGTSWRRATVIDLPAIVIAVVITADPGQGDPRERHASTPPWSSSSSLIVLFVIVVGAFYVNPANWNPFAPFGYTGISFFGHTLFGQTGSGGEPLGMLAGRGDHLLRLHRLRLGLDPRRGGEEPAARRADRHHRLADRLHRPLHRGRGGAHRHGPLRQDRHRRARCPNAFAQVGLPWAQFLISLGALAGITSVLLVMMLSQPRVLLAMARDGLVPAELLRRGPREVPHAVEVDDPDRRRRRPRWRRSCRCASWPSSSTSARCSPSSSSARRC